MALWRHTKLFIIIIVVNHDITLLLSLVFTARCYASAVLAMALCPSVRLSVRHKSGFY